MQKEGLSDPLIADFLIKVNQIRQGESGKVNWDEVHDLDKSRDEIDLEEIRKKFVPDPRNLGKLVVIKLNGGLGTSMGLSKAKSLIKVKEGYSFLHVIAKQVQYIREKFSMEVPLILMDSYNTQADCKKELEKVPFKQSFPSSFLQNKVPRIFKSDLSPITTSDPSDEWCPPGHGDIYLSFSETGILDNLLDHGFEYAFISNGDNLGATVDVHILEYLLSEGLEFAMEMTPKTLADIKGGAIYRKVRDGKFLGLELLEVAQVPKEREQEFSGTLKFRTFSTNNLWINLSALKKRLGQGPLRLSLIVNPKIIDGKEVLQLETAMGSAIGSFEKTKGIIIPRDRFAPVKKCEDYLVRRSDAYILNEDFSLSMNPKRKQAGLGEVIVSLDEEYYRKIEGFESLIRALPSLFLTESLKVEGEIEFDTAITIIGKVVFRNRSGKKQKISSLGRNEFRNEEVDF